jgi:hypothetical protein
MEGNVCNNLTDSCLKRKTKLTMGQAGMNVSFPLHKNTVFLKHYIIFVILDIILYSTIGIKK